MSRLLVAMTVAVTTVGCVSTPLEGEVMLDHRADSFDVAGFAPAWDTKVQVYYWDLTTGTYVPSGRTTSPSRTRVPNPYTDDEIYAFRIEDVVLPRVAYSWTGSVWRARIQVKHVVVGSGLWLSHATMTRAERDCFLDDVQDTGSTEESARHCNIRRNTLTVDARR